jgi:hypothetical protein
MLFYKPTLIVSNVTFIANCEVENDYAKSEPPTGTAFPDISIQNYIGLTLLLNCLISGIIHNMTAVNQAARGNTYFIAANSTASSRPIEASC